MKNSGAAAPILVVDDHPINLKLVKVVLEHCGYSVRTAVDAPSAMQALEGFHPSLILMDVQLPGINGLELAQRLKCAPATQDIVIVALTAYAMMDDRQRALAAGCDGFIAKPIDPSTFPTEVANYLHRFAV
ncbi:MAG: response regulator [Bryobacteraceae bacterium]